MATVTINEEQSLYVIHCEGGFSCLGFDVLEERMSRCVPAATRAGIDVSEAAHPKGTIQRYDQYAALTQAMKATGHRFNCDLSPQLAGLEGSRVEVVDLYGDTRRFKVGKSTGWMPIHLELARANSSGGVGADRMYKSVRVIKTR